MAIIQPQPSVRRGRAAVDFYRAAFKAEEIYRIGGTDDDPSVVSQLAVGEAIEDPFGHHWEIGKPLGDWPPH
jgi:uncharacterized glyoxalase superfamily protein PhnB